MNHSMLKVPEEGIALCLSGGGFRAALFHLGSLWRLNEFGYLPKLNRISSVSGGSIVAGLLGLRWKEMQFDQAGVARNFVEIIVKPLRSFANQKLDIWLVLFGLLHPLNLAGDLLVQSYRKHLFGNSTLQDLPDIPRIVLNSSNAQTGVLFRFSKPYIADYRLGLIKNPTVELAIAVAASSAFPPFLSPVKLDLKQTPFSASPEADLQFEPFTSQLILLDGGVYDNLGLQTIFDRYSTILISDGGGKMQPAARPKLF